MYKNPSKNTNLYAIKQITTASIVIPSIMRKIISESSFRIYTRFCLVLGLTQWEIIIVDDSSSDTTLEILMELQPIYQGLKLISLRRNFGQTAALAAGIDNARFEVIITLDGDLQMTRQTSLCF